MKKISFLKEYPKLKKKAVLLLLSFIAVFLLRLAYVIYLEDYNVAVTVSPYYDYYNYSSSYVPEADSAYSVFKNIGTTRVIQKDLSGQSIAIDQKYEKSANISSRTTDFQNDNRMLRDIIDTYQGVIQSENLTGLAGQQKLTMVAGVMPEHFDDVVEAMRAIGDLQGVTVNKVDKTAEFRSLQAEQETLIKTKESYIEIKERGGSLNDLLLLEDRILEVERQIQNLGVNLGIYASESSLCTINISLNEAESTVENTASGISPVFVFNCIRESILWTAELYLLVIVVLFGVLIVTALSLKLTVSIKRNMVFFKTDQTDHHK